MAEALGAMADWERRSGSLESARALLDRAVHHARAAGDERRLAVMEAGRVHVSAFLREEQDDTDPLAVFQRSARVLVGEDDYRSAIQVLQRARQVAGGRLPPEHRDFLACIAGPLIAWRSHGHPAMRAFLLTLPLYFLPAILMVWISARRRQWASHRFWATAAFVGPAISSLWAEALIFVCGRYLLGPRLGELVGTGIAFAMGAGLILWPAWRARRAHASAPVAVLPPPALRRSR